MTGPAATILVVDDEAFNRDVLTQEIEDLGHAALAVASGAEALRAVAERPVDLVLLDIMMPGMDGYEVLRRLVSDPALRDTPVIVVSAMHDIESVARGIELGAVDYLPKPFEPRLLAARIDASLERGRWRAKEQRYIAEIERQRRLADQLLDAILPPDAVTELKRDGAVAPRAHESVAVMFLDIVGFTSLAEHQDPARLIEPLTDFTELAEACAAEHGLEKIKTLGDAVIITGDLIRPHADPVAACAACAQGVVQGMTERHPDWRLRGGLALGPVVSGVIGRARYGFDIWGRTVNAAARLSGIEGRDALYLDHAAAARLEGRHPTEPIGTIELKGLGPVSVSRVPIGPSRDRPGAAPRP
ncbi:MAG: response regulator [Pseudomonadota bacterium]